MSVKKSRKVGGSKVGIGSGNIQITRDFKPSFWPNRSSSGRSKTISRFTAKRRTKPTGIYGVCSFQRSCMGFLAGSCSSGACGGSFLSVVHTGRLPRQWLITWWSASTRRLQH
ncbi:hypothetical protein Adt_40377 [Abeliophyllum distichum]|uniref:Uncharacterized protein n=1 Tax=Abeliophyllum distichum TaxID=126358 RepID=A0ABD1QC18_9LAMI